jgi:hypothetical protein
MAQNLSFLANLRRKMMERAKRLEKVGSSFVGGWYWSSGPQFSDFMSHGCERKLKSKRFLKNTFNRKSNGNLISQLKILIIEPFLRLRARITLFLRRSKQQHVHRHAPKSSARVSGVNVVVSIAFEFSIQPFISVLPQVYSYRQNAKGK